MITSIKSIIEDYDTEYIPSQDLTIILKRRYRQSSKVESAISMEISGCYFGQPSEELTQQYLNSGVFIDFEE